VLAAAEPKVTAKMSMPELRALQAKVQAVSVTDDTVEALITIRDALRAEGVIASDRRWKKSLRLVQAAGFMAGEQETCPEDLAALTDCLWREPKERSKVSRIVGRLADPVGAQANEILDAARETASKVSGLQSGDRKAYIAQAAQALEQFKEQEKRLKHLANGSGRRAKQVIQDAQTEINGLHADLARVVSTGLGLGMRPVK
jgi:MoxR-like ATPase